MKSFAFPLRKPQDFVRVASKLRGINLKCHFTSRVFASAISPCKYSSKICCNIPFIRILSINMHIELQELKDFCAEYLPHYIIPSKFYLINNMPLTSNGKINKELLSSGMLLKKTIDEENNIFPITSLQKRLADLWGRILDVKDIYLHDDFFDLGGHSLSVLELVSHIQDEFNAA